jgi:ligand-binding sensor domain-containing protein
MRYTALPHVRATREYATNLGRGQGLYRFDGVHVQRWGTTDGLPSDQVICLEQDGEGHVWIGTDEGGLCRWDGQTMARFDTADGLGHSPALQEVQQRLRQVAPAELTEAWS